MQCSGCIGLVFLFIIIMVYSIVGGVRRFPLQSPNPLQHFLAHVHTHAYKYLEYISNTIILRVLKNLKYIDRTLYT